MTISHDQFVQALNYLVSIEPDPTAYQDMDEYDAMMTPYEPEIAKAHATIRGYGAQIAAQGLEHMQKVLYGILEQQTDPKAESLIRSNVNWLWDGCGDWLG